MTSDSTPISMVLLALAIVLASVSPAQTESAKLLASDGAVRDRFGRSVGISGAIAVVGACQDDDNGTDSGSAYLLDVVFDCNGNGIPDDQDIASGTSADCNADGVPDECEIAADPAKDWNRDGIEVMFR